MKNTVIVVSTNRQIFEKTAVCIDRLTAAGARVLIQRGSACVAAARNIALSGACEYLRAHENVDTVLMVDDDMLFTLEHAVSVVAAARFNGVATSAMYATLVTTLAAMRLPRAASETQRWLTGLGFIAVPRALLLALEASSETFSFYKQPFREFTWACVEDGLWMSEDFRLTKRLGGAHLLPVAVGHLKTLPLYPDPHTIRAIAMGDPLREELDTTQLEGLSRSDLHTPEDQQTTNEKAAE